METIRLADIVPGKHFCMTLDLHGNTYVRTLEEPIPAGTAVNDNNRMFWVTNIDTGSHYTVIGSRQIMPVESTTTMEKNKKNIN